jgi:iron complex transport system permease protein
LKTIVRYLSIAVIGLLVMGLASSATGPASIDLSALVGSFFDDSALTPTQKTILWELRFPRIVAACLVGGSLAVAGVAFQGLFRNSLAEPYIIGASSGAALGVAIAIVFSLQGTFLGLSVMSGCALASTLAVVTLVLSIGWLADQGSTLSLLLVGVVVSSLVSAIVSLMMFLNDQKAVVILSWLMGSLAGSTWNTVIMTAALGSLGVAIIALMARALDAYSLGDAASQSLGLNLRWFCVALIGGASLATAAAVASSGIIGFVGLIAPHIARRLAGAKHSRLIPMSGCIGAGLMIVADMIARTIVAPAELPVGVVTAILGCPFFFVLLVARHRSQHAQGGLR